MVFSHILHCLIVEEPSEEPGLPVENSLLEEQQPGALKYYVFYAPIAYTGIQ